MMLPVMKGMLAFVLSLAVTPLYSQSIVGSSETPVILTPVAAEAAVDFMLGMQTAPLSAVYFLVPGPPLLPAVRGFSDENDHDDRAGRVLMGVGIGGWVLTGVTLGLGGLFLAMDSPGAFPTFIAGAAIGVVSTGLFVIGVIIR